MRKVGEALDGLSCLIAGIALFVLSVTDWSWLWSFPAYGAAGVGVVKLWHILPSRIDPRTGRPLGDHGTGTDAIIYSTLPDKFDDHWDRLDFLDDWLEGEAPADYYRWLKEREK